jgi:hypothetical protein
MRAALDVLELGASAGRDLHDQWCPSLAIVRHPVDEQQVVRLAQITRSGGRVGCAARQLDPFSDLCCPSVDGEQFGGFACTRPRGEKDQGVIPRCARRGNAFASGGTTNNPVMAPSTRV